MNSAISDRIHIAQLRINILIDCNGLYVVCCTNYRGIQYMIIDKVSGAPESLIAYLKICSLVMHYLFTSDMSKHSENIRVFYSAINDKIQSSW